MHHTAHVDSTMWGTEALATFEINANIRYQSTSSFHTKVGTAATADLPCYVPK